MKRASSLFSGRSAGFQLSATPSIDTPDAVTAEEGKDKEAASRSLSADSAADVKTHQKKKKQSGNTLSVVATRHKGLSQGNRTYPTG